MTSDQDELLAAKARVAQQLQGARAELLEAKRTLGGAELAALREKLSATRAEVERLSAEWMERDAALQALEERAAQLRDDVVRAQAHLTSLEAEKAGGATKDPEAGT